MPRFLPENPFDRDRRERKRARRLHREEQQSGQMLEQAQQISIDQSFFQNYCRFMLGSLEREVEHAFDDEDRPLPVILEFEDWRQAMEQLRDEHPRDFLEKHVVWSMTYPEYCAFMDDMIKQVREDIAPLFPEAGGDSYES